MIKAGSKFLEARLGKRIKLEEVSKATKIREDFLEAIEKGDYQKLPSSAYAYGFVRNYARFLELDEDQMIALFKRDFDSEKTFDVLPKGFSKKEAITTRRFKIGRNFLLTLAAFILIILFIFF